MLLWSLLCEVASRDRFQELSESELTSLLDQKNTDNTKKATKVALNVFRDYLEKKRKRWMIPDKLATILRTFYAETRKSNGLPLPPKNWKRTRWLNDKTII